MNFQEIYSRIAYLNFFRDTLLPDDFDITEESIPLGFQTDRITEVVKIGEVPSLDLPIFEIEHKSENDPRVTLSKEAFRILANYGKQQALILFISTKAANFRLSLVTLDLKLEGTRVTKEFSNPRRYSFFLGPQCKVHTPKEYLDNSKKGRVKDLDDLKHRFSIEVVNKEFFTQIALLFTKLTGGTRKIGREMHIEKGSLKLPGTNDETFKKEFAVRLIGRLIFCWFLKKKTSKANIQLVPDDILSTAVIKNNKGVGGYYHSVLEPLFFEVLNTPTEDRKKDYSNTPWNLIPFLNGGLFNPHDDDFYKLADTGYSQHLNTLIIPDPWLEKLLKLFETYNFTIDENTPVDVELAIEPEMLGRIFENLLAEINPETGDTARKSTGSYYTPRPIVEYMVDESLKQYLLTKTDVSEDKITELLSYSDYDDAKLTENQIEILVEALHQAKIIDPACGSGAFPMGILQKIFLMLQKLDPDSVIWLDKMLANIPDPMYRKELKKKKIPKYLHKLGIIKDCIFGVDIQPIAVEISKLRCFLSLIVDENVNDNENNRGIEHLPNLEFKFVCANTLIGLPTSETDDNILIKDMYEDVNNITKLKELRELYLTSYGKEKSKIEEDFKKVQSAMFDQTIKSKKVNTQTLALQQWKPFTDEACSWFDPDWMFGIKDGFDVVIANPPYVVTADKTLKAIYSEIVFGRANIYLFFIYRGMHLLNKSGFLTFINPRTLLADAYCSGLRKWLIKNASVISMLNIIDRRNVFESVLQSVIVNIFSKDTSLDNIRVKNIRAKEDIYNETDLVLKKKDLVYGDTNNPILILAGDKLGYNIFEKISTHKSLLQNGIKFTTGKIQWDLYRDVLLGKSCKHSTLLIYAENIQRYYYQPPKLRADKIYINEKIDITPIEKETIVVQRTTACLPSYKVGQVGCLS